jgi:hypothetical protein
MDEKNLIKFKAQIFKIQTLVDGGIRITLDMSEKDIRQAGELMQARQAGAILEVVAVPVIVNPLLEESNLQ